MEVHDIFIDLLIAKKWREEPYCHGDIERPGEHMMRAMYQLFPRTFFVRHRWAEMMVNSFVEDSFAVWLGAASAGKSHTAGILAVLDFITDPDKTYIALASTTVPFLKLRSFASCIEALRLLKQHPSFTIPVKEAPSQTAIINSVEDGALEASLKFSIRGVAVGDGSESKAVARLAGVHPADGYATIILDEASGMPEAAAKARVNASAGTRHFRFLALANPVSRTDEATKFCEPLDGWASVGPDTESWYSKFGHVLHFNAFHSPRVTEPDGDKKYPFLMSKKEMDTIIREAGGNLEDPMVARMIVAFPAAQGTQNTVLSSADLDTFKPCDTARFMPGAPTKRLCAIDPAFTAEGDGCAFLTGTLGTGEGGGVLLALDPPKLIPISSTSTEPASYQVVRQCVELCQERGVDLADVAIDDSGTQSIADIWFRETGRPPVRYNYATKSSDPAEWSNLVTEMWYRVQEWVRSRRIAGLDPKAANQFCTRCFKKIKPKQLESKKEFKQKMEGRRSPDEADATAMLVMLASTRTPQQNYQQELDFEISIDYGTDDITDTVVGDY